MDISRTDPIKNKNQTDCKNACLLANECILIVTT